MALHVLLLFLAVAADDTAGPAKVVEATISVADHTRRYVEPGLGNAAPKVMVYSPQGVCVAVLDESVRGRLAAEVADAGTRTEKACAVSPPVSVVGGANKGSGGISVELLLFDVPFCGACDALRKEFDQLTAAQPGYRYQLTKVNFGKAFNAQRPSTHASRTDHDAPPR